MEDYEKIAYYLCNKKHDIYKNFGNLFTLLFGSCPKALLVFTDFLRYDFVIKKFVCK